MRKWRYITGVGVVSASLLVVLTLSDNAQTGAPVHPSAWNKVHRSISRVLPWRSAVSHYFVEAGREMLIRSDLPSAEMYFYRALKVRRDSMDALEGLLIVKQQQGDFTGARETANQLAEIAPRHPKVMATRGYQLATEGKVEEAIAAYRRAGRLSDCRRRRHNFSRWKPSFAIISRGGIRKKVFGWTRPWSKRARPCGLSLAPLMSGIRWPGFSFGEGKRRSLCAPPGRPLRSAPCLNLAFCWRSFI